MCALLLRGPLRAIINGETIRSEASLDGALFAKVKGSSQGIAELAETKDGAPYVSGLRAIPADQKCTQCHAQKEGEAVGYLGVETWASSDFEELSRARNDCIVITRVMVSLISGAIYYQARSITRPLAKMTSFANGISLGDFSQPIDYRSADELGVLARE